MPDRYATIVADPPWQITKRIAAGGRRANATEVPYSMMPLDDIKALPVAALAADDAHLYLWATRKVFRDGDAADVARAWGFRPVGEVIWGLRNPGMGKPPMVNDHEPVLVAVRGSLPFGGDGPPMGVHFWKQTYVGGGKAHSAKPEAFLDHVEDWSPGPRLEMFARRARFGWSYWGNESLSSAEMVA
jgi:N6-adenosine-specific RNA methylase IME4